MYCLPPGFPFQGGGFPVVQHDAHGTQVSFADIFVAELGSTCGTCSLYQFTIEEILWDATFFHSHDVSEPTHASLFENGVHAGDSSSLHDSRVWHFILPADVQDAAESAHVESIQLVLLSGA